VKFNKVAIFDLFGTLIHDKANNYLKGFDWLKNEILIEDCTMDDVLKIAKQFQLSYMKDRVATHKEASHIKQLELLKTKIGFRSEKSIDEIEYGFFSVSRVTEPQEGVFELLHWLKQQGFLLFVMSNTIYSAKTIRKHLETMKLSEYFEDIFTSGDAGYRKPGYKFFSHVSSKIKKIISVKRSDIIFIGNSLEKDMIGASKFGFTPIWISTDTSGFGEYIADCIRADNLIKCKYYFKNNYIRIAKISRDYSVADGIGNRIVVYMQGCEKHCPNCHNEITWDVSGGRTYSVKEIITQVLSHMTKGAKNVTISGGEPLDQKIPLLTLLDEFERAGIDVCLYTGNDFDDVSDEIKDKIHYLKTGSYVHELRTTEKGFYGSANQKFLEKGNDGVWIQKIL